MMFKYFLIVFLVFIGIPDISNCQNKEKPVSVIFDSDMGPDYDDVGALALLHALADSGEAKILATVGSNRYSQIAEVFDVINTYFGHPDLPIGVPRGASVEMKDWQGWSNVIVSKYQHDVNSNEDVYGAVELYRKILSKQTDNSINIVTVGFLTNMADLLESKPDKYSELNGRQLVAKKVNKLVSMAGKFPSGKEFNVIKDIPASDYVFENWPTEIVLSGFGIGNKIKTGIPLIENKNIESSPIKDVYSICIPKSEGDKNGRSSWDQTAVLVAVRGADPYYHKVPGQITLNHEGENEWIASEGSHYYLVETKPVEYMQVLINELMQHQGE
ncbi:nucleoside hydrolase [Halalkalibaculum sp. DA3122]|uniref:nucleoside hydrolase n=1 Tax=Halalkalibaculum sp. DA3122 TaxID=3373607 RepID=UPI003754A28E